MSHAVWRGRTRGNGPEAGLDAAANRKGHPMRWLLGTSALLWLTAVAVGEFKVVVDEPVDLGGSLYSYTIRFTGESADEKAACFDGRFDGAMNQEWYYDLVETPTMDNVVAYLTQQQQAADSHLLLYDSHLMSIVAAHEDGPGTGSWLANASGATMAVGIYGDYQSTNLAFAQIVVPTGHQVEMSGSVALSGRVGGSVGAVFGDGAETLTWWTPGGQDSDADGAPELEPGQSVHVSISSASEDPPQYAVMGRFEMPGGHGYEVTGILLVTSDPNFTYTPDVPGHYWIQPYSRDRVGASPEGFSMEFDVTPEPSAIVLLALAAGLGLRRRRRRL